jgi:membrane protein YdbS with pleckstrin-like domain
MVAALASTFLQVGRWWLDTPSDLADRVIALAFYVMTIALWPALLSTLVYRMVTYTYRLTDRQILVDWGFRQHPEAPVKLDERCDVDVQVGWLGRTLGVGNVILRTSGERVVKLKGVRSPDAFAAAIRETAAKLTTCQPKS